MRTHPFLLLTAGLLCLCPHAAGAQSAAAPSAPAATAASPAPATPNVLVRDWLDRWNALGGQPAAVSALVQLFAPDALITTGPGPDQRGTAIYRGHEAIAVLAGRVAASQREMSYRLEIETAREQSATLLHETDGPWGGRAAAVQLVAVYTDAATGRRWSAPGAAFFQFDAGRIRRLRLYLGDGERVEIEPDPTRKRP